jgi:hypothetical protein
VSNSLAIRLPQSVIEIAEVIGRDKALHLIGSLPRSGSRSWRVCIYIPKERLPKEHKLVQILGWDDACKLAEAFAGEILQPSNCRSIARAVRDRRLREMYQEGIQIEEIALSLNLSIYRVKEILKE